MLSLIQPDDTKNYDSNSTSGTGPRPITRPCENKHQSTLGTIGKLRTQRSHIPQSAKSDSNLLVTGAHLYIRSDYKDNNNVHPTDIM